MAEPENHTLRLLRDFREEFRTYREEFRTYREEFTQFREEVHARIDNLARILAGEIVVRNHAAAAVDQRVAGIEQRLSTLENGRG